MLALLSLLGRRSSASSSRWLSRSSPAFDDGALPSTYSEYQALQERLTNKQRAPRGIESFEDLQTHPNFVFRDFTGFFQQMDILEPNTKSVTCLLRGRRWGKTVLGDAWLACLRKEEHLFKGTAVEGRMRDQPLIGVKLDLSECGSIEHLPLRLNESVKDGLLRAAKLKQLDRPDWPIHIDPNTPARCSPLLSIGAIFDEMKNIVYQTDLKFALFMDEYDKLMIRSLYNSTVASEEYFRANDFMTEFFTMLKAQANKGTIPFQFITGSSRLPMKGMWSGPNAIIDLTFDPGMAEALGYTWEQIEQYFDTQLNWLEHLHQLNRDQLRDKMEQWYDRHRWSPKTDRHVFNPWSVHRLMTTGTFEPHWAGSGSNTRLLNSKLLMKQLVRSMLMSDSMKTTISISAKNLEDSRLAQQAGEPLSDEAQKALLVGAGMLAIHPEYKSPVGSEPQTDIRLTIPNEDSKQAIIDTLDAALELPALFNKEKQVEKLMASDDIHGLIKHMNATGAFAAALSDLKDADESASEVLMSMTFTYLLLRAQPSLVAHQPMKSVAKEAGKSGQRPTADHVVHVHQTKTTHILEFKMAASRQRTTQTKHLANALKQALKYKQLAMDGYTAKYSVVVFAGSPESPSTVDTITEALTEQEVNQLLEELREEEDIEKVAKGREETTWLVTVRQKRERHIVDGTLG